MNCYKQEEICFYADDFPFHISRQRINSGGVFYPFHWHEFIEILYCAEGTVRVAVENTEYIMLSGDLLLIGPNVVHQTFQKEPEKGSIYNILFDITFVQNVTWGSLESKCVNAFLNYLSRFNYHYIEKEIVPPGIEVLIRRMDKYYYTEGDYNSIYLRSCFMELIGKFCEHGFLSLKTIGLNKQNVAAINRTAEYIQKHCHEKITLSDMADMANLSYHYYSKLFKSVTGKSFAVYLSSARVFMAEKLMLEGEYSLQQIADKVGLSSQSQLAHTYKRLRGFSPNEFMKKVR